MNDKQMDAWWGEQARMAAQEGILSEEESREWLELARVAMESDVTKEQFRAFLESEAQKIGKVIKT
ncbi:hypothetical protein [Alicyclobacillus fastidiosus]|uniref:Sin domain-containing protein n=2 Tax=Alicyclobacillus fastidiosus TaxID=392011 RepID=A0ABV5AL53_9BACL|nr:hypothetical protein [Alicyclobacillus fastidiosus]WAH44929.1 anti-repressor SinI family protein [Alicyclobacillus fastidiosus]WEH10054.1 hypothetical protein PYS47_01835 [Alicyclobacillus fastidiosus]